MRFGGHRVLALVAVAMPAAIFAQVGKPRPVITPNRDSATVRAERPGLPQLRPGQDTTRRDTAAAWLPADATMQALLQKKGYTATRYQGAVVTFRTDSNAFAITADSTLRAQIERDGQRVETDSVVVSRDRAVDVTGRYTLVPGGGQPPVSGSGSAHYDMVAKAGTVTNAEVTMDDKGSQWFVNSLIGKVAQGDSARGIPTRFYGVSGTLTSCDDSIPDYHFRMKEFKRTDRTLVARPAVMYIKDIPVMWLPFVVQDIRTGRRSGVLPPRFSITDVVRNNPNYRRHVENVGYYVALNDYMDVAAWMDWRSKSGGDSLDPGWYKLNLDWEYSWLTRFLNGRLASGYQKMANQSDNLTLTWLHNQRFGGSRTLSASINYTSSTQLQRQNTFNPIQALSSIKSSINYSDKIGPANLTLGGSRSQYPGRSQVDQTPTGSITSAPLALFSWLTWTPGFRYTETSQFHIDAPGVLTTRTIGDSTGAVLRVDTLDRSSKHRTINFDTPLRIFGYELKNNFGITDIQHEYPEEKIFFVDADSAQKERRVFARGFKTSVDWNPTFALPAIFNNRFRITPTVTYGNVDGGPFWLRTEMSGGRWVHQTKRLSYGLSASPTIFGLFPGVGPFERFRHSLSPTLSFTMAPRVKMTQSFLDYLEAQGSVKQRYLGALPQSAISFGLSQSIEAKVRSGGDTSQAGRQSEKLKVLSLHFSPLSYDFQRAKAVGTTLAGLTTENFNSRMTSDLLPGMDVSVDYSLFRGSTVTDTAEFEPFLTRVASSVRLSQRENPFTVIARLFRGQGQRGMISRDSAARTTSNDFAQSATQAVAGLGARSSQFYVPPVQGWSANLTFSMSRSRPPRPGDRVVDYDPQARCAVFLPLYPVNYEECLRSPTGDVAPTQTTNGGPLILQPPQTSLSGNMAFQLTKNWATTWNTSFDFVQHKFASQVVTLQRDMHDWRSVFAFTRAPNGNFAFTFNIALKPQPDLKFDYSRASVRSF